MRGSEAKELREATGLSQFRAAKLLGISHGQLSSLERGTEQLPGEVAAQLIHVVAAWRASYGGVKPGKRSSGKTGLARPPVSPPVVTDCCDAATMGSDAPVALSLFSGCGGLALGFARAGFDIAGFCEVDHEARSTFKRNFPSATCLGHDARQVTRSRVEQALGGRRLSALIAGPPCQGFSLAGKRDPDDERNSLFREVLRIAEYSSPDVLIIENVRLLSSMRTPAGRPVLDEIQQALGDLSYVVTVNFVNAQDFGVPQFRERLLLVAEHESVHKRVVPFLPAPALAGTHRLRTFRDATQDLAPLESGERSSDDLLHWAVTHPEHVLTWLRGVPEGCSAHDNDDPALRPPSGYNTTYKRLRWDEPASTIGTTFGMISASRNVHPVYTRSLTVREAARCQTFPDNFVFEGTWGGIRRMIGNAVPPLLAEELACHVLRLLNRTGQLGSLGSTPLAG